MLKHVRSSEVDMGIRELHGLWVEKGSCTPVLVEMKHWLEELTLNVVVRMVAGKRYFGTSAAACDEEEARLCQKAISQFFHLIGIFVVSDALPYLWWLDLQGHEKPMKKTAKDLDQILGGWLEEHRRRRLKSNNGDHLKAKCAEGEEDFIDVMLSLQEQGQLSNFQHDSDTSIKSTCLAIILGGSDTTAGTLTWAISLLLNNRHVLRKAQEELDQYVGTDRLVDESDIKNLVYLQAIIKEPSWASLRTARSSGRLHRRRVPRASCSHSNVDVRGQQFEMIPFGSGRRSCPGVSFALQVLHLTLARLLQAFQFETASDELVDLTKSPGLTIPKATPLEVLLTPRLHAKLYS
ncbi:hypothetical protein ACLB2K_018327 [Fragaria x ananassa]